MILSENRFPLFGIMRQIALELRHNERGAGGVGALVTFIRAGAGARLGFVLDGENAIADGELLLDRKLHQPARGFVRHQLEVVGLAPDDAAERDHAVVRPPPAARGLDGKRNRRRNLERARHRDTVVFHARFIEHAARATQQRVGNLVVEARFHDQHAQGVAPAVAAP